MGLRVGYEEGKGSLREGEREGIKEGVERRKGSLREGRGGREKEGGPRKGWEEGKGV